MSDTTIHDFREIPEQERANTLLSILDGMTIDQSVELLTGPGWDGLLKLLQDSRWGSYDWYPLEKKAEPWAANLVRIEQKTDVISDFMMRDHRRCDTLYADMENAANNDDAEGAILLCNRFRAAMAHHFDMEENSLFLAFEEKTGMTQGPTMVMRMEHEQMINLLQQMGHYADAKDLDGILKVSGTLLFLMQQHNVKEEQILYPMMDPHLGQNATKIIQTLQSL